MRSRLAYDAYVNTPSPHLPITSTAQKWHTSKAQKFSDNEKSFSHLTQNQAWWMNTVKFVSIPLLRHLAWSLFTNNSRCDRHTRRSLQLQLPILLPKFSDKEFISLLVLLKQYRICSIDGNYAAQYFLFGRWKYISSFSFMIYFRTKLVEKFLPKVMQCGKPEEISEANRK